MTPNMGTADRAIRVALAGVVAVLIVTGKLTGTAAIVLGALAGVFVLTSAIRFCPLYVPLKLSTCKKT